jgi:hypothetical protein
LRKNGSDKPRKDIDELRPEYNFDYSKGVRGKYYRRWLEEGSNVVVVGPDQREKENNS